ncbi:MAG: TPR end-of-group domain-containing protein, partial [Longimicrobiales bacterium]
LTYALACAGRADEAKATHDRLREHADRHYTSPYYLAVALLGLGREDEALAALERAAAARSPQLVYLKMEPLFAPLHVRPRFQAVLRTVGLP